MIGFGNSDWSYDPFEKMVIFPPDPLIIYIPALSKTCVTDVIQDATHDFLTFSTVGHFCHKV